MENLTKRGAFVLGVTVGLLIAVAFWITGNVWIIDGGIFIVSMADCNL